MPNTQNGVKIAPEPLQTLIGRRKLRPDVLRSFYISERLATVTGAFVPEYDLSHGWGNVPREYLLDLLAYVEIKNAVLLGYQNEYEAVKDYGKDATIISVTPPALEPTQLLEQEALTESFEDFYSNGL